MKKVMILLMSLILFLAGCGNEPGSSDVSDNGSSCNTSNSSNEKEPNMQEPKFVEIEWAGINWDQIEFPIDPKEIEIPIDVKTISTKEEAIRVGEAIIKNCWKNNKFPDYVFLTIVHSTKDNIWRFDYSIDQRDKDVNDLIDCGGFYVAVNGINCETIKAWVDE